MIKLKLFSDSIELQASQIANQYPFTATITYAGKLSDGFVGGTEGIPGGPYQVLITPELLRKKIKSLAGKSVLVSDLESHSKNFKIGTFLQAWVESVELPDGTLALAAKASGLIIETEENKEIVEQIIEEARAEKLGFSYDIKDVKFELKASTDSSTDQFVEVTDFEWRGATILRRDAAAYEETRLAASKTIPRKDQDDMTPEQLRDALAPLISPLQTSLTSLQTELASQKAELQALKAAGNPPPKKDEGTSITAKDFAAGIASAMAEANKPVIEALNKTIEAVAKKEDPPNSGVRRSLAFTGAEFKSKYQFGSDDMDLNTSAGCAQVIDKIHDSNLSDSKKGRMISELASQRIALKRYEMKSGGGN